MAATRAAIDKAAATAPDRSTARTLGVQELRAANSAGRAAIAEAVAAAPTEANRAIHDYAWLTDQIVTMTLDLAYRWLHPLANPTATERLATVAVGGYGRGEMAPFSDIDLLFLTPYKQTAWGESLIESVLYCLWDLRLKVGHSVRTVDDCLRLARSDITIRTALLEHRYVWGDRAMAETLDARLWSDLFDGSGPEFVEAKLAERAERHARQGASRYLLEPNVKEGKGGLRDLQTLYWIAKYLHHVDEPSDLVGLGVFTRGEYRVFAEAEAFLWMTRVHLHLLTSRATEHLTFDTQVEIAAKLDYKSTRGQRPVERFMQRYFIHAKNVGDLTRIFLAGLEARHVKQRPPLGQRLRNVFAFGKDPARAGYRLKHGRLDIADPEAFLRDPVNFLRLFDEGLEAGIPIHPDALRLVAANLGLIDDAVRADPEANRLFLGMLTARQNPERALRLMNEVGLLGAFIPAVGRVVAMMQFNMYHHYTVDEHTIQTISTLSQIERGELEAELPVASEICRKGINRRALYVALLIHDLGKGSGRAHSEVGGEIAAELCPRLGLGDDDCELVEWLVRNHLVMSDVAQKRDLADPRTVRDFANIVQSPSRLKLLTVLTVCDIRGVGPGVWNNWKAMLLRALYGETLERLTGGSQAASRPERAAAAREALTEALPDWTPDEIEAETARHYPPYWLGFDARTHAIFARLIRQLGRGRGAGDGLRARLRARRDPGLLRRCPTIRASSPASPARWRSRAPTPSTPAPTRRPTASPPPPSGCRTRTASPTSAPGSAGCEPPSPARCVASSSPATRCATRTGSSGASATS